MDTALPEAVATAPGEAGLWVPGRRSLSLGLVLTVTLMAAEALAIGTVMPLVARDLGGLDLYGWVFSAFFLAQLIGTVAAGVLIDQRGGLALPMAFGLASFGAGLLAGGLAQAMPLLIVGRILQGFGAGLATPVAYVSIGRGYPTATQPRMLAALSAAWVLPGLFGPAIAGIVASATTWRLVFLGLLPLVAVALAVTLRPLTALGRRDTPSGEQPGIGGRLPLALAVAAGAGLTLAGLGLVGDQAPTALALLVMGLAVGLPAFTRLVPPGTLRARPVMPVAVLLRGLLTFTFAGAEAYLPLAFVVVRGTSAAEAGLAFTATTFTWTAGSWLQARLFKEVGAARLVRIGFGILVVGIAVTGMVLAPVVPVAVGIAGLAIAGLGMGLAYAPLTVTVLGEAPPEGEGAASAGLQLADILGTALGAGVGGALIAILADSTAEAMDPGRTAAAVGAVFAVETAVGLVGLVLSGRLGRTVPPGVTAGIIGDLA